MYYLERKTCTKGSAGRASGKEPACQCRRQKRHGFDLWVGKVPWRREWQPTPVFSSGESQVDYSPKGTKSWIQLK